MFFILENLSSEPFCIFTSVSFFNKSYIKQDEKAVFKFDIKAEKNYIPHIIQYIPAKNRKRLILDALTKKRGLRITDRKYDFD